MSEKDSGVVFSAGLMRAFVLLLTDINKVYNFLLSENGLPLRD